MNGEEKPLTGVRKRQQIARANKQMFIWVAAAAVLVSVCAVLTMNFVQRILYQNKVNTKISQTADTMAQNVNVVEELRTEINKLSVDKNLNLPNLKTDDSTPFQVVLDALPTEDDRVSLGASLQEKVLVSGVAIEQISVTDNGGGAAVAADDGTTAVAGATSVKPTAQPITFSITLSGSYAGIQKAISDIERTIRPITINSLDLQGSDDQLQATISATTYYVPKVDYQLGSEEVQP